MRGPYTDSPRWSPDGRSIVFTSAAGANRDIFLVAAEGGPVRRLTTEPSEEGRPSWSHDGQWIYFRSNRSGSRQIWKLRADGAGGARQVTYSGAYEAFETHDGGSIFYAGERGKPGVRKLSVADGRQGLLVAPGANEGFWYLGRGAIYYPDLIRTSDVHPVRRLDITTGAEEDIGSIRHPSNGFSGFTMAPDEKSWVWSQLDRSEGGIVLVEGWR
jgi:dipeptidyl aminopeptidase/acylaminoacyl peptidase